MCVLMMLICLDNRAALVLHRLMSLRMWEICAAMRRLITFDVAVLPSSTSCDSFFSSLPMSSYIRFSRSDSAARRSESRLIFFASSPSLEKRLRTHSNIDIEPTSSPEYKPAPRKSRNSPDRFETRSSGSLFAAVSNACCTTLTGSSSRAAMLLADRPPVRRSVLRSSISR